MNAVAPGVVDTEMWDTVDALHARQFGLAPGQKKREVAAAVPSGRFGRPDEIRARCFSSRRQMPNT